MRTSLHLLGFLAALASAAPAWAAGAAGAAPAEARVALVERFALSVIDQRCSLFTADIRAALDASALQARGALLRAGASLGDVAALMAAARVNADRLDCRAPKVTAAARRAREGFAGYARTGVLEFPGRFSGWTADRTAASGWRLRQTVAGVDIGAPAQAGSAFSADVRTGSRAAPFAARLIMRDPARSPGPVTSASLRTSLETAQIADFAPAAGAGRSVLASSRVLVSPARRDGARDGSPAWRFSFADRALSDLAALDPREAAVLEVEWSNGARSRHFIEVGDVAAAIAFLRLPASP